ncbi:hypothetical protein WR25_01219 [Diploscapter pachys]|uniref:SHSP domain-containing protein n=1 Tax=Diploscapter pachys TaxID=2018661 RepID=A0A2A2KPV2_9BILA|nr:hypothetical protein WR25_01219 [Diploscapter pachys]
MSKIELTRDSQWDWPLQHNDGVVRLVNTNDKFEVSLDAQYFTPNEIEVKVHERELVIHCRHEARDGEHGIVSREVNRSYKLPDDVDASTVRSHLTHRGVLQITANKAK